MSQAPPIARSGRSAERALRDELARCEAAMAAAGPVLRCLVTNEDPLLYSDAVVARVRGMMLDLADQLLGAEHQSAAFSDGGDLQDGLAQALARDAAILTHVHAVVLESAVTERLQVRDGIDEVLSPLLQELVASDDPELASLAKGFAGSQARFMQNYRQMALPVAELPAGVFEAVMNALRAEGPPEAAAAEQALRGGYDQRASRLGFLETLLEIVPDPRNLLSIGEVGLATFVSALAKASRQERDLAVLSLLDAQAARLALALRATGLSQRGVERRFHSLHPDLPFPEGVETLSGESAAALLRAGEAT